MAHIMTLVSKLWKPSDITVDKISSQKMFVDNIDKIESLFKSILQANGPQVADITTLKAINTSDSNIFVDGHIVNVLGRGLYQFIRTSSYTADDIDFVSSTVGGGMWVSIDMLLPNKVRTAGGTGTAITINGFALVGNSSINIRIVTANNGASTTINGKQVYREGTTTPPYFEVGKTYKVWYNSTSDCLYVKSDVSADDLATRITKATLSGIIPTTGWSANSGDYLYKINIAVAGILSTDFVDIILSNDSHDIAQIAELSPSCDSYDGGVTFYTKGIPTETITFTCRRYR